MEEKQIDNKIENVEKKIAIDVAKTEEKVEEHEITQKQADEVIKEEVKEEIERENETNKPVSHEISSDDKSSLSEKSDIDKTKKIEKKPEHTGPKKTEAIVNGRSLPISTKHAVAICNLIRNKDIDKAISIMEQAEKMKIAVPMTGEIPHRKGKMMSGRYPVKASKHFVLLLKSLRANALMNELELEKYRLFCKANIASRPYRRFGKGRFKRTHVTLKLILAIKKVKGKNK